MNQGKQITRQLDILRTLMARRYGATLEELSQEFGVNKRTVQRDIEDLCEAGFPLYDDRREGKVFWRLAREQNLPVNFPVGEVIALLFALRVAESQAGTSFREDLRSALRRVRLTLPEKIQGFLDRASEAFAPYAKGVKRQEGGGQVLDRLTEAVLDRRVCEVTYVAASTGRSKTYGIEPFKLFPYHGGLYVFVRVQRYGDVRMLAVERIKKLEVTEERFEPPDFSVEDYFRDAFGLIREEPFDVKVRFTGANARYAQERIWHPGQKVEALPDGDILLSFRAGGAYEIKSWVLSYGPDAEVIEPGWLREEVRKALKGALDRYKKT